MKKSYIKISLVLTSMMTMMAGALVAPALPLIGKQFSDVENSELLTKLIITLPALIIAIISPLVGIILDKFGRKKVLLISLLIYAISGSSAFLMNDLYMILLTRAILGIAISGISTSVITLVGDYFKGSERNKYMGLQSSSIALGAIFFVSIAGFLTEISWQTPFLVYLYAFPIFLLVFFIIKEPKRETETTNLSNKENGNYIPYLKLTLVYLLSIFSMIVFYMMPVQVPFLVKSLENISGSDVGFALAAANTSSALVAINFGRIKSKLSFHTIYIIAYILIAIAYYSISNTFDYTIILLSLVLAGFGYGLILPTGNLWVMKLAPESHRGRLIGISSTSYFLGQFISPIVLSPIIAFSSLREAFFWITIPLISISLLLAAYKILKK